MIIGFFFTIIAGSLLHFVYGWSNNNPTISVFAPMNESTWEHLKMFFTPTLLFTLCTGVFYSKRYGNLLTGNVFSLFIGIIGIIVIFYTYTGILGDNYLSLDILTFVISTFLAYGTAYIISKQKRVHFPLLVNVLLILLLGIAFVTFTFNSPDLNLFQSP